MPIDQIDRDALLDQEFGAPDPAETKFTGDVVDVWPSRFTNDKGETRDRITLVIRDWQATEQSENQERAYTRKSGRVTLTTDKRATLTRLRAEAKKHLGVDVKSARGWIGMTADWMLKDVENTRNPEYNQRDVPFLTGKPSYPKPSYLAPYVPPERHESEEEAPSEEPVLVATDDAKTTFLDAVIGDKTMTEADIKKAVTKNAGFRDQFPSAYTLTITGQLVRDLVSEGALVQDGNTYRRA